VNDRTSTAVTRLSARREPVQTSAHASVWLTLPLVNPSLAVLSRPDLSRPNRLQRSRAPLDAGQRPVVTSDGAAMTGQEGAHIYRPELVVIHGYETKYAMHALRLGCTA